MPLTVTGFLSNPAAFGDTIERVGRRAVAGALRRAGNQAILLGQNYASELGPSRSGNRRRDKGVSYRNGFEATYTGVDDFAAGVMQVSVRNRSRHARVLEVGASAHTITPKNKTVLAWPSGGSGMPDVFAKKVRHPGFTGHHILERSARDAMAQSFVGQTLGHANINIRVGR